MPNENESDTREARHVSGDVTNYEQEDHVDRQIEYAQRGDIKVCERLSERVAKARAGDPWWHAMRRTGMGGSDIAPALGLSPWKKPIDVYQEKVGELEPFEGNERTRWGQRLEPIIADHYAAQHPEYRIEDPKRTWRHEERWWQLFTVDRTAWLELIPKRVVEIKARGGRAAADYGEARDAAPFTDLCQLHWYLAGTELPAGDLAVLFDTNQYREFHVERDAELEDSLLDEIERFWKRHVIARVPPPPDGSDSFKRYLQRRFSKTTGALPPSTLQVDDWAKSLRLIKTVIRWAEKLKPQLEQNIAEVIGPHDGIDTTGGVITYKFDRRGRISWQAVCDKLTNRLNLNADELREIVDSCRNSAQRRFLTPRAWTKDTLTAQEIPNVTAELADGNEKQQSR
jgi:putative phage-type endonuclease